MAERDGLGEPGVRTGSRQIHDVDPVELAALAAAVARTAGELIVRERPEQVQAADTKSSETDVVTAMDRRSEELIRALLARARPADAVLGEEGDALAGDSGLTWVVDPIDGTVNYLYGIDAYAVSVAVGVGDPRRSDSWEALAGAVFNPRSGEMFRAARGDGAWSERAGESTRRLRVRTPERTAVALVATGFGYDAQVRAEQGRLVARLLPQVRDIRRSGSAALDLCAVAAGRLDGYYEAGLQPWDKAAGVLIVQEAGGAVQSFAESEHGDRETTVAASEGWIEQLRDLVTDRDG